MRSRAFALSMVLLLVLSACSTSGDDAATESGGITSDDGALEGDTSAATTTIAASTTVTGIESADAMEEADDQLIEASASLNDGADAEPEAQTPNATGQTDPVDPERETPDPVDTGRDIIRTAIVTIEVPDVTTASQEAIDAVASVGGLLFNQDTRIGNDGQGNRTTLVFRVPPSDFQRVLNQLSGVGDLVEKQVDATDVTGRVVDLQSRITSTELSVERLRGFLAGATDLTQIATFENELRNRETDLETLRGQLRTLENQVALSTITVSLLETVPAAKPTPEIALATSMHRGHDGGFNCGAQTESAETGSEVSICFEVRNVGETAFVGLDLQDAALDLELDDLQLVEGTLDEPLEPGQTLVFVHEFTADGTRILSSAKVQATAVPAADSDDPELASDTAKATADRSISVFPRETAPGFGEGLRIGLSGLAALIGIVLVTLGFVLPFIWVFPIAFFAYRAWRRRQEAAAEARRANVPPAPTPPVVEKDEPVGV